MCVALELLAMSPSADPFWLPSSDMSAHQDTFNRFIELFSAPNEEIRNAAAFATGQSLSRTTHCV